MRKYLSLLAILMLSVSFVAQLPQVRATDRHVPTDDYPTIQAAVTAADPGDTIIVAPNRVYRESVTVEKSVFIEGEDKSTTIVDGSGEGYAFWLSADDVTITGFTLRYCSDYGVMAYYSGGHTIEDNIFLNNAYGVYLTNSPSPSNVRNNYILDNNLIGIKTAYSNGNTISYNYISEGQYGIKVNDESQFNSVANNTIVGTSHGIYIRSSANNNVEHNEVVCVITGIASVSADYTNIQNNTVSGCAYGIELYSSMYNTVSANTASGQNGLGVYLVYANDNQIISNIVSNNDWGIRLHESNLNTIIENTFSFNGCGIELISYSNDNTIAWNHILNNTLQMHQDSTSGGNTWNKKTGGTTYGNYWSNYTGEDTDNPPDGVGDTRLPHFGVDNYPLINPWSTVHDVALVSVVTSDNEVYRGELVNITVVVRNEGTATETFTVTAKYINRIIGTELVANLARLNTEILVFGWDTNNVPLGFYYEIKAETSQVAGETDKFDNTYVDGEVHVKMLGDIDGDNYVGSGDAGILGAAYGWYEGDSAFVQEADFDDDGYIGSADAAIIATNYGKTC